MGGAAGHETTAGKHCVAEFIGEPLIMFTLFEHEPRGNTVVGVFLKSSVKKTY